MSVDALEAGHRFQVITEHPARASSLLPTTLASRGRKDCVFIQVTLNAGRTVNQKAAFTKPSRTDGPPRCAG
jgi:4-oxalocrotonate tautomerase